MLIQRQVVETSSGQQFVKYFEGDQHLWKGKEVIVSPTKCYITMLPIGYEILLLRCEPYFPALSQLASQSNCQAVT